MGRPVFSTQTLELLQHESAVASDSHAKQLAGALEHAVARETRPHGSMSHLSHSDSEDETIIDERFIDPTSEKGIRIKVEGLSQHLSPLARRIVQELPTEVIKLATSFEEVETGRPRGATEDDAEAAERVVTLKIHYKNGEVGQCSVRPNAHPENTSSLGLEISEGGARGPRAVEPRQGLGAGWADLARRHAVAEAERESVLHVQSAEQTAARPPAFQV
ncbi:hypothetical protein OIV83_003037 [Microbotryomycetes sp. JL201]|nr:hypothetical protein OIV83_003037 [Microbotryomycetes sp. JL201]